MLLSVLSPTSAWAASRKPQQPSPDPVQVPTFSQMQTVRPQTFELPCPTTPEQAMRQYGGHWSRFNEATLVYDDFQRYISVDVPRDGIMKTWEPEAAGMHTYGDHIAELGSAVYLTCLPSPAEFRSLPQYPCPQNEMEATEILLGGRWSLQAKIGNELSRLHNQNTSGFTVPYGGIATMGNQTFTSGYWVPGGSDVTLTCYRHKRLQLLPQRLPDATVGVDYGSVQLQASGDGSFMWISSDNPDGMWLQLNGILTGTPTTAGTFPVVFRLRDSGGSALESYLMLMVQPAQNPCTNKRIYITGSSDEDKSYIGGTPVVENNPGSPPPDDTTNPITTLRISQLTGGTIHVRGYTPDLTAPGEIQNPDPPTMGFTLIRTHPDVPAFARFTFISACKEVTAETFVLARFTYTVTSDELPPVVVGQPYDQQIVQGGAQPYTVGVNAGDIPPGLSFTPDGHLKGTPTGLGSRSRMNILYVKDSQSHQLGPRILSMDVRPAMPTTKTCQPVKVDTQKGVDPRNRQPALLVTVSEPADSAHPGNQPMILWGVGANHNGNINPVAGTNGLQFWLSQIQRDQAVTVNLTVKDICGNWNTFVGGGVDAFR